MTTVPRYRYVAREQGGHVALATIRAFERALDRACVERVTLPISAIRPAAKVLSRLRAVRGTKRTATKPFIVTMIGPEEHRLFPWSLVDRCVIVAYDVWPSSYPWWSAFFRRHHLRVAFMSSSQSARWFLQNGDLRAAFWLPEAIDADEFESRRPLAARSIDVLELGRKNEEFHSHVLAPLMAHGLKHLYQVERDRVIFPTRDGLVGGLADTKVLICYPACDTHPARAGNVETLTQRYLEGLASGCVLAGRGPRELVEVLGFDPVIRLESSQPVDGLLNVLANIGDYQALVDRGVRAVRERANWDLRVESLQSTLEAVRPLV
jgi:hypothetical protein